MIDPKTVQEVLDYALLAYRGEAIEDGRRNSASCGIGPFEGFLKAMATPGWWGRSNLAEWHRIAVARRDLEKCEHGIFPEDLPCVHCDLKKAQEENAELREYIAAVDRGEVE